MKRPALPLLCLALLVAPPAAAQSAKSLNTEGFRAYQKRQYPVALGLFKKAIEADDEYALAHYNFAATLGVLRTQDLVCQHDAYKPIILDHLERAISLDARRKSRARRDRDFAPVHDTVRFQRLLGNTFDTREGTRAVLESVSWFGPAAGVLGASTGVAFQKDGRVSVWKRSRGPDDAQPRRETVAGKYTVEGTEVTLELDQPFEGQSRLLGKISPAQGTIEFPAPLGKLTDSPPECSA